jgi:hypothetical protein
MIGTKHLARCHRNDELWQPSLEIISLDNECWSGFSRAQIGMRKEHQNHLTALAGWLMKITKIS